VRLLQLLACVQGLLRRRSVLVHPRKALGFRPQLPLLRQRLVGKERSVRQGGQGPRRKARWLRLDREQRIRRVLVMRPVLVPLLLVLLLRVAG
jgi:hypothetical protein